MDEHAFFEALQGLLSPNTDIVMKATESLKKDYYTKPESLVALIKIVRNEPRPELRQLAAVEARRQVNKMWGVKNNKPAKISDPVKAEIREALLQGTIAETVAKVRHSSARIIAAIAKIDLPMGMWTDLPNFLTQAAQSPKASDREVGVFILYTLLESLEEALASRWQDFVGIFRNTIQDPESPEVRLNTLLALGKMAEYLDVDEEPQSGQAFAELMPHMVKVLRELVDEGDDLKANPAFEVFQNLLILDYQLINTHFSDLIQFFVQISADTNIDDEMRSKAIGFLISCLRYKKMKVQALRCGETLTHKTMQIVTEFQETDDADELTPSKQALGLLDVLATNLPPSQVIVPLLNALPQFVNNPDPRFRRAGILSLGMTVEGAPDFIVTQMDSILPIVLQLLNDPDLSVRQAALHCVTQLADDCAEEMGKEHAKLIPLLANFLSAQAGGIEILRQVCNALDSVLTGMEEADVQNYLPAIMPKMFELLGVDDYKLKCATLGGIGAAALASKMSFAPYFETTMQLAMPFTELKGSDEELDLRSMSLSCLSDVALSVDGQGFAVFAEALMRAAEQSLHLGNARLREQAFWFFGTIAKVYKEEFAPFLPVVTKALFETLESSETDLDLNENSENLTITGVGAPGTEKAAVTGEAMVEWEDDDDDEDDDSIWAELDSASAVAMEKEVAGEVLGEILTHCQEGFLPYLQNTVEVLGNLSQHNYEGVRRACIATLWRCYSSLWQIAEKKGMEKWQPGLPLKVHPQQELKALGKVVMAATLTNLAHEVDAPVVIDMCQNIAETLKLTGPAILADESGNINSEILSNLTGQIVALLQKQHASQIDVDEVEIPELAESAEVEWAAIESATDVLLGLAMALGSQFVEVWGVVRELVVKYASSTEPIERSVAVGVIADAIKSTGASMSAHTEKLLQLFQHRLRDENADVKSNAAYATGLLCQFSTEHQLIRAAFPAILEKLEPLLQEKEHRMKDNATGCLSRMIMAHPDAVNIADVLPVIVGNLPLVEDYEENEPVFKMLVGLYKHENQTVFGLTGQLVPVFSQVLSEPNEQLDDETRGQLCELIKFLASKDTSVIANFPNLVQIAHS